MIAQKAADARPVAGRLSRIAAMLDQGDIPRMQLKIRSFFPLVAIVFLSATCSLAQEKKPGEAKAQPPAATGASQPAAAAAEKNSVTQHTLVLNGRTIHYTATAGNLLIRDKDSKPNGSIFYVAYTENGATAKDRPVTFLYNGGPGSSTIWLHMGAFGPMRVETASPKATPPPPYRLVPNQYSLLDKSDLVFIDAMGTGFSRPVGNGKLKDFLGVDQDVLAFNLFIARYLTVNKRWNSPKFLIGESYGTTRSAALVDMLANNGVQMNGVVLISSILNYNIRAGGYDMLYISNLPSYAAAAWYFNKIPNKPANVADWVQQAREFASGAYAQALFQGHNLPAAQLDTVAK
ncbi:MAG TPA: hypothetical protein VII48_11265, partial [Rhizomicrobium sp.]